MPARYFQTDVELSTNFNFEDLEGDCVRMRCKACPAAWDVDIDPGGVIRPGERNALLQHARVHSGGGSRMRRVAG